MKSLLPPTAEELDRVAVLCARPESRAYFFDRLDNPEWVSALAARDFFANPPAPVAAAQEGYVQFPPWPEGRYLVRVAARAPEAVSAVLQTVGDSENPTVTRTVLDALANLPDAALQSLSSRAEKWIAQPFADHYADSATTVVQRFLKAGLVNEALRLVSILLDVKVALEGNDVLDGDGSFHLERAEPKARLSDWEYEQVLTRVGQDLAAAAGVRATETFSELLLRSLGRSLTPASLEEDDYSYVWRSAIEDHEQNLEIGLKNALVSALRDVAVTASAAGPAELDATVDALERGLVVHRRIALHVLANTKLRPDLAKLKMLDREVFDNPRLRHEYARLLEERFGELDQDGRAVYLSWVEAGPNVDEFRRRCLEIDGTTPTDEDVQRYADAWRRDHYSFVERHLDTAEAERFQGLVEELGPPQHPAFLSWSSSWTGPESPESAESLSERTTGNVIAHLRDWRPDADSPWHFAPSIEGLGDAFAATVTARASDYALVATDLADLDPTYVRSFFSGLEAAVRSATPFSWREPLILAAIVVAHDFEPDLDNQDRGRDPGWRWCRKQISSLLQLGFGIGAAAIPFELRELVWPVLERLANDPNPSPEHEARYGGDNMDPLTLSLNTNRGAAMHAVVEYALWCRRALTEGGVDDAEGFGMMPEVLSILDAHLDRRLDPSAAVRAVYGKWLPWLSLIDERWVASRSAALFPDGDTTIWDTYISWCAPYDSVFRIIEDQYRAAVGRMPTTSGSKPSRRGSVDLKLGEHLITFYWRGQVGSELIDGYYSRADDDLAADATGFVGDALRRTSGELAPQVADKMREFWDRRFDACHSHPDAHTEELRAFGTWFASGKLDKEWALPYLEQVADLVGAPKLGHLVVQRLAAISGRDPIVPARILTKMLDRVDKDWSYMSWRDDAKVIAEAALSGDPAAKAWGEEIVDRYVRRGELGFRSLMQRTDT
jgi:hypothetical protein